MLCPGLACSWKHSSPVQMPAAHAELHSQQDGTCGSAARTAPTHMLCRPASADHAAGSEPVSWLSFNHLHSGGTGHRAQGGGHPQRQPTHGCVSANDRNDKV